ncbi:serine/threonine-protein kinase [Catenulispora yoronensis]|uniref:serine/threonine-protein kinase n=1 Tax=Catenulispora yoronensis TaxID=450799 RepID=UPI0031D67663
MTGWTVPGYTETASLGSGATGRVVAAVEDATGAQVAIKYLSAKYVDDEAFVERFRAEAELLAGLDHPNVVRFHRYVEAAAQAAAEAPAEDAAEAAAEAAVEGSAEGSTEGSAEGSAEDPSEAPSEGTPEDGSESLPSTNEPHPAAAAASTPAAAAGAASTAATAAATEPHPSGAALVMELVQGATLRKVLKTKGPVSPEAALSIMRGSLLGLDAAHTLGIVHRDYKPSNVLITEQGVSKLADFGIAERAGTEMPAIGTPSYMAPEQWEGAPAEPVTDIYAVTASFYECLTGHVPYAAETVFELEELHRTAPIPLADVPPAVRGLVAHGLAKDAGMRPADVSAFIAELEEAAISEYGVEWEEEGRRNLAVFVWPLSSGSAGGGPGGPTGAEQGGGAFPGPDDSWFDGMSGPGDPGYGAESEPGRAWQRVGRGTKFGLTAAAVAVVGSVAAAVAFGSGGQAKAPVAGSVGVTVSAAPTTSLSPTPTPTLQAGVPAPSAGSSTPTPTKSSSSSKPSPTPTKSPSSHPSSAILPTQPPSSPPDSPSSDGPSSAPSSPPSTSAPSTSAPPSTSPSATPTIVGRLELLKAAPVEPCPPADLPTYRVVFTGQHLPAGTSVSITYTWRMGKSRGVGPDPVNISAKSPSGSGTFSVGSGTQSSINDSVTVSWSATDGESGTTNSAGVTINCEILH